MLSEPALFEPELHPVRSLSLTLTGPLTASLCGGWFQTAAGQALRGRLRKDERTTPRFSLIKGQGLIYFDPFQVQLELAPTEFFKITATLGLKTVPNSGRNPGFDPGLLGFATPRGI